MKIAVLMVLVGLAVPSGKSAQVPQTSLVGTWRLLSRTDREGGHVVPADGPLGADAVGLLVYDAHHVSAQLMARRRDSAATNAPSPPTVRDPNNSAATGGYDAYFGRYELDPQAGVVTHLLEGALSPADVGRRLVRQYRLMGDTLTLWFEARRLDGRPVQRTLVWIRAKS